MSRRKQSNPQHITKKSDLEVEEVARSHNVPSDIVQLKASEPPAVHEYVVASVLPLPRGSSFGPYKASRACADGENGGQKNCTQGLQFTTSEQEKVLITIETDTALWLQLVRTVNDASESNVTIYLQDNCTTIWCEITRDIPEDAEIVAVLSTERTSSPPPPTLQTAVPLASPDKADDNYNEDESSEMGSKSRPVSASSSSSSTMVADVKKEALSPTSPSSRVASSPHHSHHSPVSNDDDRSTTSTPARMAHPKTPLTEHHSTTTTVSEDKLLPPAFPLIHVCLYCGVKFSSPNTLQAHVAFYCSKKPSPEALASLAAAASSSVCHSPPSAAVAPNTPGCSLKRKADVLVKEEQDSTPSEPASNPGTPLGSPDLPMLQQVTTLSPRPSPRSPASSIHSNNSASSGSTTLPPVSPASASALPAFSPLPAKVPKVGSIFSCTMCGYTCDKRSSLNRHMKVHDERSTSPKERIPLAQLFCHECDIQFTSKSTYQGHKDFYCEARRRNQSGRSSTTSPRASSTPPAVASSLSPRGHPLVPTTPEEAASVNPERAALMAQAAVNSMLHHSMSQAALVMAPMIAPNGMTYNVPTVIMQPIVAPPANTVTAHNNHNHNNRASSPPAATASAARKEEEETKEQPLDLSVKKEEKMETDVKEEEMKRSPQSLTPRTSPPAPSPSLSPRRPPSTPPAPAPAPILIQPTPRHISKCNECNIVFYKMENYIAHKEHYCSARRTPSLGDSPQNVEERMEAPVPRTSPNSSLPVLPVEHNFLQFYCIPCKIKFSSMDTLQAHQGFYCPARKLATASVEEGGGKSDEEGNDAGYVCAQCQGRFPSARLLKLHLCTVATMPVPLFRCPYCEYIAQSDGRLIEHIKAHAPSKAYRCTICGYRGNTVRGMRMHGKMHIDSGENFSDENMLEFEEPPLIPKRLKPIQDQPVDIEGEIMRLKNQPYKRRRSTKMYMYAEHKLKLRCDQCSDTFTDQRRLLEHMKLHEESRENHKLEMSNAEDNRIYKCTLCEFTCEEKSNLALHIKMAHERVSPTATITNSDAVRSSPSKSPSYELMDIKRERQDGGEKVNNQEQNPKQSSSCSPPVASSSSSPSTSATSTITRPPSSARVVNGVENSVKTEDNGSDTENRNTTATPTIAVAPQRLTNGSSRPTTPLSPSPAVNGQISGQITPETAAILAKKNDKMSPQYCKQCDITFMYVATFLAHKKYYCNSHKAERNALTEV